VASETETTTLKPMMVIPFDDMLNSGAKLFPTHLSKSTLFCADNQG
jgi:hypothetical protein